MKNNLKIFVFAIIILLSVKINTIAEEFTFEGPEIKILDEGNLIKANNGSIVKGSDGMVFTSDEFTYDKKLGILRVNKNVNFKDPQRKIEIDGEEISFNQKNELITSIGTTSAKIQNNYFIKGTDIFFDRKNQILYSNFPTTISDKDGNFFSLTNFNYSLDKKLIRGEKIFFKDIINNKYYLDNAFINLEENEILGKNLSVKFNKSVLGNPDNDPRLKGKTLTYNKKKSIITKGVFTSCKKRDKCPPWTISAEKIEHNKDQKLIKYKNAWLKIYDVPVFYFPKFFHPDPTVERKSGFLMPKLNTSNLLGTGFEMPYFHVVSDSKDLTFKPRFYNDEGFLIQTEARAETKNSSNIADFSFTRNNDVKENDDKDTRAHFFSSSQIKLDLDNYDTGYIDLNIQKTSNDTYLKLYKIDSPIINNFSSLKSSLDFAAFREDFSVESSFEIYEDLGKSNNDKFTYVYPNYIISKDLETDSLQKGSLTFQSSGFQKQFNTNVYEGAVINNLLYQSNPEFSQNGIKNKYELLFKNVNTSSNNSSAYKVGEDYKLLSSFLYESSFPLKKDTTVSKNIFIPKISYRFSPNNTRNIKDENRRVDMSNIFSNNRIGSNDTIEGGQSITLGANYKKNNVNNDEILSLGLAQVYRNKVNPDLPTKSTIGRKTSDLIGQTSLIPNEYLSFNYDFSFDNNLGTSNYDLLRTSLSVNNFVTSFEFLEEKNEIGNDSFVGNKTSYTFDNSSSLGFSTRRNRKTNLTEFYNLIYQYKNDCLTAAVEYNKEYYTDNEIKPDEQIFISLTIVPFGQQRYGQSTR